jgi:ribosomal protein S18 acetylase RimI-like enzyme
MIMEFIRADKSIVEKIKKEFNEEYIDYLHFDDGFTFIALDKDKVVGFVSSHTQRISKSDKFESYIDVIEVKAENRRCGIATKLLILLEEESKKEGLCQIRAWSSEDRKEAIAMWEKCGFFLESLEIISSVTKKSVRGYYATKKF